MAQRHASRTQKTQKTQKTQNRRRSKKAPNRVPLIIGGLVIAAAVIVLLLTTSGFHHQVSDNVKKAQYPLSYSDDVTQAAQAHKLDPNLVYAVIRTESNFQKDAESGAGARGLMQLMPETFTWLMDYRGEEAPYTADDLFNPSVNIDYGCYFLRYLLDYFDGDEVCAVAAYNGGMNNVSEWLKNEEISPDGKTLIAGNIPFDETRSYVRQVEDTKEHYRELYGQPDA